MKTKTQILAVSLAALVFGCSEIPTDSSGADLFGVTDDMDPNAPDLTIDPSLVDMKTSFNFDFEGCTSNSKQTEVLPLDIVLALDNSYSMDYDGKWEAVKAAIKSFSKSGKSAGISLGLQYYPARKTCSIEEYSTLALALTELPAGAATIATSLDGQVMGGSTPMVPLFEGMFSYLKEYQAANPKRKVVFVLATDGVPDASCQSPPDPALPNTLDNVILLAGKAQTESPSIQTFVIGVGENLTVMDQVAAAGGSGKSFVVDIAGDTQTAFFAALDAIRQSSLQCEFEIPEPEEGKAIVYDQVNVSFTTPAGIDYFANVGGAENCAMAGDKGWYYDNPDMPTRVRLCPSSCDSVRLTQNSRIDIIFGCATIIP